jgi:hypothetical protein
MLEPVGAELFHRDRRTDGQTSRHEKSFRNFAKALNKIFFYLLTLDYLPNFDSKNNGI